MSRPTGLSRHALAAAMLLLGTLAAHAQDDVVERQLKAAPGRDVRVGVFTDIRPDCTSGPLPAIRLATPPAHGSVNVKRGTLKATNFKQCLAAEVPAPSRSTTCGQPSLAQGVLGVNAAMAVSILLSGP